MLAIYQIRVNRFCHVKISNNQIVDLLTIVTVILDTDGLIDIS